MAHNKRLKAAAATVDRTKNYGIDDAVKLVKGNARAEELLKFVLSPKYIELRRALGLEGPA